MRAFCTVSAPLEVCAPPTRPLCPGARFLALRLLGTPQARTLYFLVEAKSRVREVYAQTCLHFAKQGMLDTELFGLAVLTDGEYLFADPESKLSKYGPKSWRSSHTHGLDANGRPLLELHFRVQFYIESPLMLRDETSRHYYYLQLKANAVSRDVPKECSEQSLLLLGGLALQADLGDSPEEQSTDYFRHEDYIPAAMHSSWGASALNSCHREYRAMSRADAETHYIREACALHEAINAHIFRMKSTKSDSSPGSVWLAVYAKGIKIMGDTAMPTTFLWPSISKLSFERKKFEIRSGDNKIIFYASSDEKNKMLLALCRETHQFSMKIAPRLTEAIKREEEESSCIHTCYIYSRSLNLPYNKNKNDQRISVISSTSSNTTSGIISDRVHSEDELEIMINSPPAVPIAAPSTESLALAHLLDRPSVSRQASSVGQVSLKGLEDTLAALSVRSMSSESTELQERNTTTTDRTSNDTDSPGSQHNISSQCSSTCSTVVVATETVTLPTPPQTNARRHSTCSSLELGFSHTAQNSVLSEVTSACLNHDEEDEEGSSLGVYTLAHTAPPTETSGVYTMSSSEMAESESHESSHYGSFQPNESIANLDSVDGNDFRHRLSSDATADFRIRSDSNVSASGSFRGDGSDPTDNKHALLSAEELTDLIVGRGTYPNRKTVSNTLDSDCDYVTLPLPLEGDSYIQGHKDTAPTEEEFELDILANPPTPPKRINSTGTSSLANIVPARRSPPPYNSHHETTGLCGPAVREEAPAIPLRDPPPYPQQPTPRPPSTAASVIPEEAAARFITTRPHINILKAHTSVVGEKPSFAAPTIQPPTPAVTPTTTIGIPIVPYSFHAPHKSMPAISPPHPPYLEAPKSSPRTCVLLPVIKPRQYLPPPPQTPRQPPPPPPPQLATVYSSQLARSQIELYQQQLYSDVDYVIYPIQDPAVSQQEYLDAKQGSILAAMAQSPPPPPYLAYHAAASMGSWDTCKGHTIYRSTPYLPMAMPLSSHSRYASTQNLSDSYVQLPGAYSPLYSPSVASLCSSYEPPPPLPLRPRPVSTTSIFSRSRSDDNILNSIDTLPKARRLPPPPPPVNVKRNLKPPIPTPMESLQGSAGTSKAASVPSPAKSTPTLVNGKDATGSPTIDIHALREKSKNLDLPLIAALCNDRSLLKQTKAFVMPRHPRSGSGPNQGGVVSAALASHTAIKGKYPVSGLSTVQLAKPRKSTASHRHPSDKLPPLPCQCQTKSAEGNNYVMDPTPTPIKHKSFNSQPST
ncbi:protein expanded [Phlebotomus argentipes]|uniref:protein expanded n=1 Tax=Phlebotomus argentipes TaxID=94469 RepID=UPI0028929B76|nr:protein expanded [Phlebotomus argentipes]